jgi:hypothetical protein
LRSRRGGSRKGLQFKLRCGNILRGWRGRSRRRLHGDEQRNSVDQQERNARRAV